MRGEPDKANSPERTPDYLLPCELHQGGYIIFVCGSYRVEILLPGILCLIILSAPGKNRKPENLAHDQVGHQSGVPPVAIREAVNGDKPVFESNSDFVSRISTVINPIATIFKQ